MDWLLRPGHIGANFLRRGLSCSRDHDGKFFIDTEFIESGPNRPIELLSIGIVAEDGRTFYAVDEGAVLANANAWVQEKVLPHLGGPRLPRDEIRLAIKQFIGDCKPEFWGYYADYDWVVFCQIFGAMIDLPKGWPMYCRDIKQLCDSCGNPKLPEQTSKEHNALNDARWNLEAYKFLALVDTRVVPESTISASPVVETTRKSDLAEALRQAIELITGHHEIGFIRRAFEQTTGSCKLCKESRLFRIGQVLEKYDAAALADTRVVEGVQEAPQPTRKFAEEFIIKFWKDAGHRIFQYEDLTDLVLAFHEAVAAQAPLPQP